MPTATNAELLRTLSEGELEVEGQLVEASNIVLRVWLTRDEQRIAAVHKPVRGERPLHDFPGETLAARERAAYLVSEAGGWDVVPPTVLRDGPFGIGSVQLWVGPLQPEEHSDVLTLDPPDAVPKGNLPILTAEDEDGDPFIASHLDDPWVRSLATFDAVVNNADRKASAVIDTGERRWAIDHGLCFHHEPKLRTVFWGFAQDPLTEADRARCAALASALADEHGDLRTELGELLAGPEVTALQARVDQLLATGELPPVPTDRYPLPWPLW